MGHKLTSYNTIKGTTILLSTSLSILMASTIGMPVSTTYIMVGCTIGTVKDTLAVGADGIVTVDCHSAFFIGFLVRFPNPPPGLKSGWDPV